MASTRSSSNAYLDGLRAIAVLAVIGLHSWAVAGDHRPVGILGLDLTPLFKHLYLGVDLFFLLSGFLLARPWFSDGARPRLVEFWKRRLKRIAPAFYVSIVVTIMLFGGRVIPWGELTVETIAAHLLFIHNYIPVASTGLHFTNVSWWTLTVEMTWYLVLPVIAIAFAGRRWFVALPVFAVVSWAWLEGAKHGMDGFVGWITGLTDADALRDSGVTQPAADYVRDGILVPALPSFLLTFALGVGLAKMWCAARRAEYFWTNTRFATVAFVASLIGMVVWVRFLAVDEATDRYFLGVLLAVAVYGVSFGAPGLRRPLTWLPLRYLGWVSYGVYLYHLPVIEIVTWKLHLSVTACIAVTVVVASGVATASWLLIERPFLVKHSR
ncbi:MAG: acyltransferase [Nocardiaceae bacterium]|nr:acyltransferase [Nocardiaceae bacterium]